MKARIALLISLLLLGGIGADWLLEDGSDTTSSDVRKMDGSEEGPPPSPHP